MFIQMMEKEDRERLARAKERERRNTAPTTLKLRTTADFPGFHTSPVRGVYRDDLAPDGWLWYKIVESSGKVSIVHISASLVGDPAAFEANLILRLEAQDRILKAI